MPQAEDDRLPVLGASQSRAVVLSAAQRPGHGSFEREYQPGKELLERIGPVGNDQVPEPGDHWTGAGRSIHNDYWG